MTIARARERCWAEIDLDAVIANYRMAQTLSGGAKVLPVLKANAYGLGAVKIARTLGADFACVASMEEAEELLDALPNLAVLVLGRLGAEALEEAIERGVRVTAYSPEQGAAIVQAARRVGKKAVAHIKCETGLHRIGFADFDQMAAFAACPEVEVEGLFSHLALRDKASDESQFSLFDRASDALARAGVFPKMRHIEDSIGMVRYPDRHMDAVRTGAWLYGVCPRGYAHPENCRPTLTLKTRVSEISVVPKGGRVGYDDESYLARDTRVATLSAGYIDGVPRKTVGGCVEIAGKRAPILGFACMDQMMADVTDVPEAREGCEVTLLGGGIGVDEYAAWGNLNRNECLARVGRRVPRIYLRDGNTDEIALEMSR